MYTFEYQQFNHYLGDIMTLTKADRAANAPESLERLTGVLSQGSTIYALTRKVSASGASRQISFYVIRDAEEQAHSTDLGAKDFRIEDASWHIANVLDYAINADTHALKVHGGGMDMQWHVVSRLSREMFGNDTALLKSEL